MDPPYYPENEKSFVEYNSIGFNEEMHKKLFNIILNLKCKFLMSNSNVIYVKEFFNNLEKEIIICKRCINSKNPSSITNEIMIYNLINE